MKRQIAVVLCFALLLSSLYCGCALGDTAKRNPEAQRQEVILRFLEAIFLTDPAGAAACVPEELQTWIYESCISQDWNGADVSFKLYEGGEVENSDLRHIIDEYRHIEWEDGQSRTDGGTYGMIAVLIDGQWYALPGNL